MEIIRVADEMKADLIVMGAHDRAPMGRSFGSTTSRVVGRATCPVLTLHQPGTLQSSVDGLESVAASAGGR